MPGGKRTYKLAKTIQKINSERKYIDEDFNYVISDAVQSPIRNVVRGILPGTGHQQRSGDVITPSKFIFTYSIYMPQQGTPVALASLDYSLSIRVLIVQWHEHYVNTSAPTIDRVLDLTVQAGAVPADARIYAPYVRNTDEFTVLYDKIHTPHWIWLPQQAAYTSFQPMMQNGDDVITIKIKNMKEVSYDPASADGYEHILIWVISDSGATPHPVIRGISRFNYYDS